MAALVQSYPQQSGTVTMLQTRPSSASGILQATSQGATYTQNSQPQRNSFHGLNSGMGVTNYRGHTAVAPIAPYAFTSTPGLALPGQRSATGPHLRPEQRTSSAPAISSFPQTANGTNASGSTARSRYPAAPSVSTTSSTSSSDLSSMSQQSGTKDDSVIPPTSRVVLGAPRPHSTVTTITTGSTLSGPANFSPVKPSPDRYRRPNNRRAESTSAVPLGTSPVAPSSNPPFHDVKPQLKMLSQDPLHQRLAIHNNNHFPSIGLGGDDMQLHRSSNQDQAKRYRRRSIHTIDDDNYLRAGSNPTSTGFDTQGSRQVSSANGPHPLRSSPIFIARPATSHGRNGSSESVNSTRSHNSRPSSATKREPSSMATANPAVQFSPSPSSSSVANALADQKTLKHDVPRLVNIPPRSSSSDAARRIANPSPLSQPMTMTPEPSASKGSFASAVNAALQPPTKPTYAQVVNGSSSGSPAAQQLAALNSRDGKKSKTSRLRRAFSFGSAAELRKASVETSVANNDSSAADRSKLHKDRSPDDPEAEQNRIAQQQEAGGIGSGIYSGQGNYFIGSTDNISISSTASSASIMIRKMGKGMKKSTRSLVGLFRPKSVIGVPAADAALPQGSQAQVSMVTVEAERKKVNVNADPHDYVGGGSGFPKLEMNSVDTSLGFNDRLGSSSPENPVVRRSIVGGDKERAEVLAAVKKGILKRSGTDSGNSSPVIRPHDLRTANFNLPQVPHINDSPSSSAPSTPNDEQHGHRRTGSVTLGGEDYFMSALRFQGESKSVPSTPQGTIKRNATFSPRIQFHDTWPSGEYDRRGEIATCNRLTPMLAQQIKEELNTFKMEMEVHENSKIYTHFF